MYCPVWSRLIAGILVSPCRTKLRTKEAEKSMILSMIDRATPIKIEKIVKQVKNHRYAFDFDKKFILQFVGDGREVTSIEE
jgi:hypothetical protein